MTSQSIKQVYTLRLGVIYPIIRLKIMHLEHLWEEVTVQVLRPIMVVVDSKPLPRLIPMALDLIVSAEVFMLVRLYPGFIIWLLSLNYLFVVVWDETGIAVYFFPRNAIPDDITGLAPQPQTWGLPFARWPATSCNSFQFFNMHSAIFDTTLW